MKPMWIVPVAAALCFFGAPFAFAQTLNKQQVLPIPAQYTNGEVLEVNRKAGTIVMRHEFIVNLGMDPMAMEFEVDDRTLLNRLKRGDKVRFKAVYRDGKYVLIDALPRK